MRPVRVCAGGRGRSRRGRRLDTSGRRRSVVVAARRGSSRGALGGGSPRRGRDGVELVLRAVARAPVRVRSLGRAAVASEGAGAGDVTGLPASGRLGLRGGGIALPGGTRAPRIGRGVVVRGRRRRGSGVEGERVAGAAGPLPILHLTRVQRRPAVGRLGWGRAHGARGCARRAHRLILPLVASVTLEGRTRGWETDQMSASRFLSGGI